MKTKRNLSGIYFKHMGESVCFEELPEHIQDIAMEGKSEEWLKSLAKVLANTLNEIADKFNIVKA